MAKRDQLQKDIDQMQEVYNDASTPADVKETLKIAIEQAKKQMAELPQEKAAPATSKKKAVKIAKPAKKTAAKKPISLADCKEIVAKYTKGQKKEKQRIAKRKKAGKPTKLTVPETLKKTAKVIKSKVEESEDKGKKITRSQQDAAIDQIVEIAGAVLDGLKPQEYTGFIDRLNKAIRDHLTKSGKKAEHGVVLEGGSELPSIGSGVTQSGNMRIGSYRTVNFDISPDAQKLFDELSKASEGNTNAYFLTSTAARDLDELLGIVKEVQVAERATRLEYTKAISHSMLFMYWLGKLFDKLPGEDNINRFYPRFLPGYLYFLANKLPADETPEMAAFGKRLKSAVMRDRAYQSDEPWEQDYERKGSPKHPRYAAEGMLLDYENVEWSAPIAKYVYTRDGNNYLVATAYNANTGEPEDVFDICYVNKREFYGEEDPFFKEFIENIYSRTGWKYDVDYKLDGVFYEPGKFAEHMAKGGKLSGKIYTYEYIETNGRVTLSVADKKGKDIWVEEFETPENDIGNYADARKRAMKLIGLKNMNDIKGIKEHLVGHGLIQQNDIIKPDASIMAKGGKAKINPDYKWFAFNEKNKKIVAGYESREDVNSFIKEMEETNPDSKLIGYSKKYFERRKIDPYDSANWSGDMAFLGMTLINSVDNTLIASSQAGVI